MFRIRVNYLIYRRFYYNVSCVYFLTFAYFFSSEYNYYFTF